jgi:hypothetical protein
MRRNTSIERLEELRGECLADDLPVEESMTAWTEDEALRFFESGGEDTPGVTHYPRVWLTSDVHTDRPANRAWVEALPTYAEDAVIIAGDVAQKLEDIEWTLRSFTSRFRHVFFAAGNHDLWVSRAAGSTETSLQRLAELTALCSRLGVHTGPKLLRAGDGGEARSGGGVEGDGDDGDGGACSGVWVCPLDSWSAV